MSPVFLFLALQTAAVSIAAGDQPEASAARIASLIAAYALAFARLNDSARWAWSWLPTALQPIAPALLAFATDLATGMGGATSYLQIAQSILVDLGPLAAAIRGALPAKHFKQLDPASKTAIREVRQGKPLSRRPPPMEAESDETTRP